MKKKDLVLLISLKLLLFIIFAILYQINSSLYKVDGLFVFVSDTHVYFTLLEEYINSGNFNLIRLPGILPIYGPLYLIFGQSISRNLLILLQFAVSIWSIWLFSKIVFDFFGRKTAVLFIIISSISIPLMDIVFLGLMDSFSISFIMFSIYYFYKWENTNTLMNLFLSGVFITWSFFLREIAIIPYLVMAIMITLIVKKAVLTKFKLLFVFSIFFIVCESLWVGINYYYKKEIVIIRKYDYAEEYLAMKSLAGDTFGGRYPYWYEGGWFYHRESGCEMENFPFSDRVFTPDYNLNDLIKLKTEYCGLDFSEDNMEFLNKVENIKQSYKKYRWYDYYFINYIRHLKDFLFETTVFIDLPVKAWNEANIVERLLKVYFIVNYNTISIIGIIGLVLVWFRKRKFRKIILISLSPLFFLIAMHLVELRYIYPMVPIFIVGLSVIISNLLVIQKRNVRQ